MAEMLTYEQHLTSATGGRGSYHMEYSHYEEVPHAAAGEDHRRREGGAGTGGARKCKRASSRVASPKPSIAKPGFSNVVQLRLRTGTLS